MSTYILRRDFSLLPFQGALQNADITQGDALSCELTAPLGRNMENELRNLFFTHYLKYSFCV